jgi:integrase/recombinase XerD
MKAAFAEFIQERRYLSNVTPATVLWYENSLKWISTANPSQDDLRAAVMAMRQKGLSPSGCNSVIRAINAYVHWKHAGSDTKCGSSCTHPKLARLKAPSVVLPTLADGQVRLLIAWKPKNKIQRRLHALVLFLLDTGCRISEALGVRVSDLDFENLLVRLDGKGRKQRLVPISFELRKVLVRLCRDTERRPELLLFANRNETALMRRNVLRDVKQLCRSLGFMPPRRTLHAFRHTFAVSYLRRGGSVFHLQKTLGHSTLDMTRVYANLMTDDLRAVHERVSLLSA